jgi:hypothetical protein
MVSVGIFFDILFRNCGTVSGVLTFLPLVLLRQIARESRGSAACVATLVATGLETVILQRTDYIAGITYTL